MYLFNDYYYIYIVRTFILNNLIIIIIRENVVCINKI